MSGLVLPSPFRRARVDGEYSAGMLTCESRAETPLWTGWPAAATRRAFGDWSPSSGGSSHVALDRPAVRPNSTSTAGTGAAGAHLGHMNP